MADPPLSASAASTASRCTGVPMRIALAAVPLRSAASPSRKRGSPSPASRNPRA